jgi:catechol 2,3-dioxygenase-like lactoylglutathione lyase family enzyme
MLLNGFNHVAILTNDAKRLHAFYGEVFDAPVTKDFAAGEGGRGIPM